MRVKDVLMEKMMKYYPSNARPYKIDFQIKLDTNSTEEMFAFVVLVKAKFNANITSKCRFKSGNALFGSVVLTFDEYDNLDGAKLHCQDKLTSTGKIKKDYVGALDYADRGFSMTNKLIKEIKQMELNNSGIS